MKPFKAEKAFWDGLLSEWACSAWDMILRTFWLAVFVAAVVGVLRLMSWADEGARDLQDNTTLPSERARQINYGPR